FCIVFYLFYKAYRNTHDIVVNDVKIPLDVDHPEVSSMRILHISDLHLENISITSDVLYDKLQNEKIDLIALTGDFLDRKRTIAKLKPYLQVLQKLKATYGMYAVFGNHDYVLKKDDFQTLVGSLQEYGCQTLRNAHDTIEMNGRL